MKSRVRNIEISYDCPSTHSSNYQKIRDDTQLSKASSKDNISHTKQHDEDGFIIRAL